MVKRLLNILQKKILVFAEKNTDKKTRRIFEKILLVSRVSKEKEAKKRKRDCDFFVNKYKIFYKNF